MTRKRKIAWAVGLGMMAVVLICSVVLIHELTWQDIRFDEESSYFSDFYIHEETGTVDFVCELVFENRTKRDVKVQIRADFSRERDIGLISDTVLQAVDASTGEGVFPIPSHGRAWCKVKFTGRHAGRWQKSDRNLPDHITVTIP